MKTFTDYLQEIHARNYHGTDDNMPDSFEAWISELQVDDLIKYADKVMTIQNDSIDKLLIRIRNLQNNIYR